MPWVHAMHFHMPVSASRLPFLELALSLPALPQLLLTALLVMHCG
jgi:hypothetical protein